MASKNTFLRLLHFERRKLVNWLGFNRTVRPLRDRFSGQRAFLIGNGPSLAQMDLSVLDKEFVATVNMGLRGAGTLLPHVDMHMVMDDNRYRRFAAEIETLARDHHVAWRFMPYGLRAVYEAQPLKGPRPCFIAAHPLPFARRGPVTDLRAGISSAATVLISAVQVLYYLGFRTIYVIGCDLDYETSGQYSMIYRRSTRCMRSTPRYRVDARRWSRSTAILLSWTRG